MAELGSDFSCIDDITPDLAVVSGVDCLEQSLARELQGSHGDLWYDPEWGGGFGDFINSVGASAWAMSAEAERVCSRDERVESVSADATIDTEGEASVRIAGETSDGPFGLVASIGADGVIATILGG